MTCKNPKVQDCPKHRPVYSMQEAWIPLHLLKADWAQMSDFLLFRSQLAQRRVVKTVHRTHDTLDPLQNQGTD